MRDTFLLHVVGLWLLAAAPAHAQPALADPTRPAGFTRAASTPAARSGGGGGGGSITDAAAAVPAPVRPTLQSLQVSAGGGSSALVDGRVVRVGDRLGETVVVTIDTQGILLRGPRYEQRIALVPGGGKTASTPLGLTLSKPANTAASVGSAAILTAPLITRPKPAVVVVPKEPQ